MPVYKRPERGVIINREYATQVRDFRGLRFGSITPTDIDGFIDFGNRLFVLIECKFGETELPLGQRLALERLCDAADKSVPTIVVIISHRAVGMDDIDFSAAMVTEYRWRDKWLRPERHGTCREFVDVMRDKFGLQNGESQ